MNGGPVLDDVQEEFLSGPLAGGTEGGEDDVDSPLDDDDDGQYHPTHNTMTCGCRATVCCPHPPGETEPETETETEPETEPPTEPETEPEAEPGSA